MTKYLNPSHDKESDGTKFFVDWSYHNQVIVPEAFYEMRFCAKFYKCFIAIACAIYIGFSKIRSAESDSNCKRSLVYCVSVVDASSKMFNSESS